VKEAGQRSNWLISLSNSRLTVTSDTATAEWLAVTAPDAEANDEDDVIADGKSQEANAVEH
jgi:hypothetical protein